MTNTERGTLEQVKQRIGARLRAVCAGMPEAAFQAMVDRMAHLQLKYEARRADESAAILAALAEESRG